ncbi:MAG: inosine/guanosine kinase [Deltaproteobacteria bacterium]|nr:inosine/guanosine kinase [Deltaproteobacteria bacterium]
MRFPGQRIAKHYFPVTQKRVRAELSGAPEEQRRWYLVGLDQILVDVEVRDESLGRQMGLRVSESVLLADEVYVRMRDQLRCCACTYAAGGAVGNTINNYTHLSGEPAILLGAIDECIRPGEAAFHYVAQTPTYVDLSHLVPAPGTIATAFTFVATDGERSFAVAPGNSNAYPPQALPLDEIRNASAVLTTLYCLRDPDWPIAKAALRMMEVASEAGVPVALGMGTASLVKERRQEVCSVLERFVTVAAMNAAESVALTGSDDVLLACRQILDWVDMVIVTEGARGLTMGGWVDEAYRRQTRQALRSKSIPEYNRWEYSRLMRRAECQRPQKIYTHIHPYRGGPDRLTNTNGAGDAALAAVLHDIAANQYHRDRVPGSDKHAAPLAFLTYSSLSRNAQYGNRVAYEVLKGHSPRLSAAVGHDEER